MASPDWNILTGRRSFVPIGIACGMSMGMGSKQIDCKYGAESFSGPEMNAQTQKILSIPSSHVPFAISGPCLQHFPFDTLPFHISTSLAEQTGPATSIFFQSLLFYAQLSSRMCFCPIIATFCDETETDSFSHPIRSFDFISSHHKMVMMQQLSHNSFIPCQCVWTVYWHNR